MNTSNIMNYKPKDFAELIGVSVKTLQRWDREGILEANRTPTDRRYYT
ncbi:MerR family DNA-binding transcriptional regulator, partial [Faecalicatena sp. BF-R-105]|nr:MerR family DNA-binding transcriptional regulator [Faecalicatena sp. BF-R-105]